MPATEVKYRFSLGDDSGRSTSNPQIQSLMVASTLHELAALDQTYRELAKATALDEVKSIRDKAEAARTYVKAAQLGLELQNRAAELKLRAERKAGMLLTSLKLRGGDRRSNQHRAGLKLEDLGISSDQSRRWQQAASVTDEEFHEYLKAMKDQKREVTSAGLLRIARKPPGNTDTAQRQNSPDASYFRSHTAPARELLDELRNHCSLLGDVLRPVYEGGSLELKGAERRVIGRLIAEMSELIAQLNKTWPSSNARPNF